MNPKADFFFKKASKWQQEYVKLRSLVLDCSLDEELKWGCPCYTFRGQNIVLLHGFKEYCALLFFQGALLKDETGLLVQQTKNVQSARQIRFTGIEDVTRLMPVLKAYVYEAIELDKAGLKLELKQTQEFEVVEEFQKKLDGNAHFRAAFEALTPGRQRGYLLYFSQAKMSKTRQERIEKYTPHILAGKGLHE